MRAKRAGRAGLSFPIAAASGAVGYACLRLAISAAVHGMQSVERVPHHHLRHPQARRQLEAAVGAGGCGGGVRVNFFLKETYNLAHVVIGERISC